MSRNRRRKSSYCTPRKGTKTRAAVNLLLRREGATNLEVGSLAALAERLRYDCGFDIAAFPEPSTGKTGRPACRYKIIGRYRWDGSYRSFVSTNWE